MNTALCHGVWPYLEEEHFEDLLEQRLSIGGLKRVNWSPFSSPFEGNHGLPINVLCFSLKRVILGRGG